MTRLVELFSQEQYRIRIDVSRQRVEAESRCAGRPYTYCLNLAGHPLSTKMCEFLITHAPSWPAGTLIGYAHAFRTFVDFATTDRRSVLNAETFAAYIEWLKTARTQRSNRFIETTRRAYANFVLLFMEWLVETCSLTPNEAHAARLRHRRAFKGSSARQLESLRANAVVPEDYVRLIRAARLEFEESTKMLEQPKDLQDQYETAFPLLTFTILLGATSALRSSEFNNLCIGDLRGDRLLLNPPDKPPSEITLSPDLIAALELAQRWMSRYRDASRFDDPLLVIPMYSGPRAKEVVRFDTMCLGRALKSFYEKYFNLIDDDGIPYLCTIPEDEAARPLKFSLSFRGFRSAALTEAAREETNPEAVMRFARHLWLDTTLKYYVRETHRQWVENIATYLAPSAERFRIALENKIAKRKEETAAGIAGAIVPGGHCQQAVIGDRSCQRSVDCRLCQFFRIHPSKREYFVAERDSSLRDAVSLSAQDGLERDAQNLRQFAALNEAIINRIDDHASRRDRT
jgi:hypothetical protein